MLSFQCVPKDLLSSRYAFNILEYNDQVQNILPCKLSILFDSNGFTSFLG